ncbi:MAG: ATP-binding protein [Bacteroidales bacterium]|nr:ATP-binding protein [Bacteroidales bacterium]
MPSNRIIGRVYEQAVIKRCLESDEAQLVAVYGRRRVGKTFLIKEYFNDQFHFMFTGVFEASRDVQLLQFQKKLEAYSGKPCARLSNWFDAFEQLSAHLESVTDERIVVFFDELPWMDTPRSNFLPAFTLWWNEWASRRPKVKVMVCGSSTTWMMSHLIGDRGGLYGRVTRSIYLAPFNLGETEQFLAQVKGMELSRYQILEVYMVMGGIPYYLNMLDKSLPLSVNFDNLFFKQGAPLRSEFAFLFRSLFKESKIYYSIVRALARHRKGMTRMEIKDAIKAKDGGALTEALTNLELCDFVRKFAAIGKKERDGQYQLTDLFSLFHLRFVDDNTGQDEHFWTNMMGQGGKAEWCGYAFEQVCLHHLRQIKQALSISGVLSNVHSWSCRAFTDKNGTQWGGAQIDLLIDRSDNVINFCEMKYATAEYSITADYEAKLRNRAEVFKAVTKTRKAIQHTFVTTYGVRHNLHSGLVQSEVTINHLFALPAQ